MTTGQIVLLLVLIFGLILFFTIGVWGINRLKSAEDSQDERCFSTELSKKTVLSNRRITLNFLNIGGI
jgi:cytochrome oxidase assembly protein ShyY1